MYGQINACFAPILSNAQWGFQKEQSVSHCLIVLIKKCLKFLDKDDFSGILETDLSKAFDNIDHELLMAKIHAYGSDIESFKFIKTVESL